MSRLRQLLQSKVLVVATAVLAATSIYFYVQYQNLSDPNREAKELVSRISKFYELPTEMPIIATVTDQTRLVGQLFFARALDGDKVLYFQLAQKAVLFRPSDGKIVNVAPIEQAKPAAGTTTATPSATPAPATKSATPKKH